MFGVLLLLSLYLSTAETASVTLTEQGYSGYFPWPASGKINITLTCSSDLPHVNLLFYRPAGESGSIYWDTNRNELVVFCRGASSDYTFLGYTFHPFTHDCTGGYVTLTYQYTADKVLIWNKGEEVAERARDGWCKEQPEEWQMALSSSGIATVTYEAEVDGGYSSWTEYGSCSKTTNCATGKRTRTRTCTEPKPSNGGAACRESATSTETCYAPCKNELLLLTLSDGETITYGVDHLGEKINDKITKVWAKHGDWILYEDANYGGLMSWCVREGQTITSVPSGLINKISSVRPSNSEVLRNAADGTHLINLFQHNNRGGIVVCHTKSMESFYEYRMDDRTSYVEAVRGEWIAFKSYYWKRVGISIPDGYKGNLVSNWNDKISSIRTYTV